MDRRKWRRKIKGLREEGRAEKEERGEGKGERSKGGQIIYLMIS